MNNRKFCFIICTNDPVLLDECIHYIQHLIVPDGYEVELLAIEEAGSMAAGYQEAMDQSDAKYKIYLHQDVFILNRSFLADLLSIFENDPEIGMIGMAGYERVSPDGIMWHQMRLGAIYQRNPQALYEDYREYHYSLLADGYVHGAMIDGLLMATAYDLPWNTQELTGFDFYDAFQSMEFLEKGYKIAIPIQRNPWCLHDDGKLCNMRNYDQYRQLFLKKYDHALGKDYHQIREAAGRKDENIIF